MNFYLKRENRIPLKISTILDDTFLEASIRLKIDLRRSLRMKLFSDFESSRPKAYSSGMIHKCHMS